MNAIVHECAVRLFAFLVATEKLCSELWRAQFVASPWCESFRPGGAGVHQPRETPSCNHRWRPPVDDVSPELSADPSV